MGRGGEGGSVKTVDVSLAGNSALREFSPFKHNLLNQKGARCAEQGNQTVFD